MKKSLLLIDLFVVIFIVFACRNSKEPKPEVTTTTSSVINEPVSKSDTSKTGQTSTSGLVGTGQGIKKDTDNAQAIIHPAPNKAKIDSVKNLKTKNKR